MSEAINMGYHDTLQVTVDRPTTIRVFCEPHNSVLCLTRRRTKLRDLRRRIRALEEENRLLRLNSNVDDD